MTYHPSSITRFASQLLGRPLYPYQSEIAEAILSSILNGQGRIFTVMLARQSGKNQLSADPAQLRAHAGPCIQFFSAGPESNVVGATADLLLEIDEAQDVECEKFDRDFRPMATTTSLPSQISTFFDRTPIISILERILRKAA